MSPSIAGVTLLALGNGAPNITTILVGIFTGKASFALGDVGGGIFDVALVMGAISLAVNVRVSQLPFVRDVVFYIVSSSYIFYIFLDNRVTIYEGIICLVIYVIYVLVVVIGRIINVKFVQKYKEKEGVKKAVADLNNTQQVETDVKDAPISDIVQDIELDTKTDLSVTTFNFSEDKPAVAAPETLSDWTSGYTKQRKLSSEIRHSQDKEQIELESLEIIPETLSKPVARKEKAQTGSQEAPDKDIHSSTSWRQLSTSPRQTVPDSPEVKVEYFELEHKQREALFSDKTGPENTTTEQKVTGFKGFMLHMFNLFLDSISWHKRNWYEKIFYITIQWLPDLILSFTIPKVEDENWNRLYVICIPMLAPIVILYAIGSQYVVYLIGGVFPIVVVCFLAGAILSLILFIILWRYSDGPPKLLVPFLVIIAFVMCTIWLYIVANEVQNMLQALGEALGIGDGILAVTVVAWGNSIGDFVANVAVARRGYGSMGVGACYGGPLLNQLVGLGIAFTFNPTQLQSFCYPISSDPVIAFSFIFLIMTLLLSAVIIPACGFKLKKAFGVILIFLYITFIIFAILASVVVPIKNAFTWNIGRGC
jgi:sodium/potassium/calcium exchanger 6